MKPQFRPCLVRFLSAENWIPAADNAIAFNPANAPAVTHLTTAMRATFLNREYLALMTTKYWGSDGVHLTVGFMDNPPSELRKRIIRHMNAWSEYANVSFSETNTDPEVRIARMGGKSGGYWSYLGTDIKLIDSDKPTMNLEAFSMETPESEFIRVVRHETGHTLGFVHEHLRAEIVENIDRERAINYFMATQGWEREDVIEQVLKPLDEAALIGTEHTDMYSIMCYGLPADIMKDNLPVPGGTDINQHDAKLAARVYPKVIKKLPAIATADSF